MLHGMIRIPTGLRPVRIDHRLRQSDRDLGEIRVWLELVIEAQYRDPLARQRLFLASEPTASGKCQADQQQQSNGRSAHLEAGTGTTGQAPPPFPQPGRADSAVR